MLKGSKFASNYKLLYFSVLVFSVLGIWINYQSFETRSTPRSFVILINGMVLKTSSTEVSQEIIVRLLQWFLVSSTLSETLEERKQILRANCKKKPPNPSYIEDADFSRFIVIEKLKLAFCFIPKISCTTWKRTLYKAKNNGTELKGIPHQKSLFSWLKDYSPSERKKILKTYYKAIFVREPFARLLSAYLSKATGSILMFRSAYPNITRKELKGVTQNPFPIFVKYILSYNHSTIDMNQHWRSYEQICPCEVDYDFIGHFENIAEEAPELLNKIGVDHYVSFPEYHPSKANPKMLEYYSQLSREEIFKLGKFYELDFKLFGYEFPGPLQDVLDMKAANGQGS